MFKKVRPFNYNQFAQTEVFTMPAVGSRFASGKTHVAPLGGSRNLLDDVTDGILRRIEAHERFIFEHLRRHNASVHDHHSRMSFHHPYHARGDHPLNRGRRGMGRHNREEED